MTLNSCHMLPAALLLVHQEACLLVQAQMGGPSYGLFWVFFYFSWTLWSMIVVFVSSSYIFMPSSYLICTVRGGKGITPEEDNKWKWWFCLIYSLKICCEFLYCCLAKAILTWTHNIIFWMRNEKICPLWGSDTLARDETCRNCFPWTLSVDIYSWRKELAPWEPILSF